MSAIFQGIVLDNGRVKILQVTDLGVPAGAVDFRGMKVSVDERVIGIIDSGQNRVIRNGIAFERQTGFLLISDGPGPYNRAPGGLIVDPQGAVAVEPTEVPDVVHQGVGLMNPGDLNVQGATLVPSFLLQENDDKFILEDDSGFILLE